MIKITAKKGKIKGEMKGNAFEIMNEAIEITKAFYITFNKKFPKFGDYYLHRINTELKEIKNEEPTDFVKGLMEIIEDMRKDMAEDIEEEKEEENEKDNPIYPEHKRHRRY
jgi:Mg2+ and Co2+ transporter CorA